MVVVRNLFANIRDNRQGSVIVLLAIGMTALIGSVALVADMGFNYVHQTRLSVAADAAALAGGRRLNEGRDAVIQTATNIAVKNGVPVERVFVEVDESGNSVTVSTQTPIRLFFANIFRAGGGLMEQRARVAKTRPVAIERVFPLGVDQIVKLDFSKEVNLFSSELLGSGNWGALAFKDESGKYLTGSSILRENLQEGHQGIVEVGDTASTSGGVAMGPVRDGINHRFAEAAKTHTCSLGNCPTGCERILIMPIYKPILDNNSNKTSEVEIIDFAAFWVSRMTGQGANTQIWGHFIRPHVNAAASVEGESPYGLTTIRMIQ